MVLLRINCATQMCVYSEWKQEITACTASAVHPVYIVVVDPFIGSANVINMYAHRGKHGNSMATALIELMT